MLAPTILESPAPLLARQWRKGFDIAKLVTGPLSLACGVAFGALAYRGKIETYLSSSVDLILEFANHPFPHYVGKMLYSFCNAMQPLEDASAVVTCFAKFSSQKDRAARHSSSLRRQLF